MLAFRLNNLTVSMTVSQSQAEQVQSFLIAGAHRDRSPIGEFRCRQARGILVSLIWVG